LRPHRDELIISTKAGYYMWPGPYGEWGSRKYLIASLDQSLGRHQLMQDLLEPQFLGLVNDDEQHLVVLVRNRVLEIGHKMARREAIYA